MKKAILEKFSQYKLSRQSSSSFKGGVAAIPGCNNVGCPSTGGSCTLIGPCLLGGTTYGAYSCTQPAPRPTQGIDSLQNIHSGPVMYSGTTTVNCTGNYYV